MVKRKRLTKPIVQPSTGFCSRITPAVFKRAVQLISENPNLGSEKIAGFIRAENLVISNSAVSDVKWLMNIPFATPGEPRIGPHVVRMAKRLRSNHPDWSSKRIANALRKRGISISATTVLERIGKQDKKLLELKRRQREEKEKLREQKKRQSAERGKLRDQKRREKLREQRQQAKQLRDQQKLRDQREQQRQQPTNLKIMSADALSNRFRSMRLGQRLTTLDQLFEAKLGLRRVIRTTRSEEAKERLQGRLREVERLLKALYPFIPESALKERGIEYQR